MDRRRYQFSLFSLLGWNLRIVASLLIIVKWLQPWQSYPLDRLGNHFDLIERERCGEHLRPAIAAATLLASYISVRSAAGSANLVAMFCAFKTISEGLAAEWEFR